MDWKETKKEIDVLYNSIQSCQGCRPSSAIKMKWPWVGNQYCETKTYPKILFVGINMNRPTKECADLRNFINDTEVQKTFLLGNGLYGFMPTLIKQIFRLENKELSARELYEYFAVTNIIKCSPNTDRSRPADEMWNRCSFIRDEIKLLEPDLVVAMGDDCYKHIIEKYDSQQIKNIDLTEGLKEYIAKVEINSKITSIIKIDHQSNPIAIHATSKRLPLILDLLKFDLANPEASNLIAQIRTKLKETELRYFIVSRLINLSLNK